jgi:hypothetical protein
MRSTYVCNAVFQVAESQNVETLLKKSTFSDYPETHQQVLGQVKSGCTGSGTTNK